jgi:antitoxin MazE
MKAVVKKWGNSASVRIPASVMQAAKLRLDQPVDVREEAGRVVIEAIKPPVYDLDALLDGITPENLHEPVESGPPIGKEAW